MRPYRGKRKDNGEWVYGCLVDNLFFKADTKQPVPYIINPDEYPDYDSFADMEDLALEVDPDTVGQYTGLHDDSGDQEKLYKGDIVKVEYDGETHVCEVQFFTGSFAFVADSLLDGFMYLNELADYDRKYGWVEGSEKIGNRWDHPHLLEVSV